jgi:hypothetical protein
MSNTCKKVLHNEKLLVCAISVQLLLGCAFTLLVEYGYESNGAFLGNSLHGVFVQVDGPKSGKNSLPNSYYSICLIICLEVQSFSSYCEFTKGKQLFMYFHHCCTPTYILCRNDSCINHKSLQNKLRAYIYIGKCIFNMDCIFSVSGCSRDDVCRFRIPFNPYEKV